jgi:predicted lipoprotein with Yx(FWY)xxD motif
MTSLVRTLVVLLSFASVTCAEQITIASKDGVGQYLRDQSGKTLYVFRKLTPGKNVFMGNNKFGDRWQPAYFDPIEVGPGLSMDAFSTVIHDDGSKQIAYRGLLLYRFNRDDAPGDTKGHLIHGVWFAAPP